MRDGALSSSRDCISSGNRFLTSATLHSSKRMQSTKKKTRANSHTAKKAQDPERGIMGFSSEQSEQGFRYSLSCIPLKEDWMSIVFLVHHKGKGEIKMK